MKNLILRMHYLVFFLAAICLLESCGDKDDPQPSIIGVWTVANVDVTITSGTQSYLDLLVSSGFTPQEAQLILAEVENSFDEEFSGKIEFKNGGSYVYTGAAGNVSQGTWELSADGKKLTFDKGTVDEDIIDVTTLSSSSLTLTKEFEDSDFLPNPNPIKVKIVISCSR